MLGALLLRFFISSKQAIAWGGKVCPARSLEETLEQQEHFQMVPLNLRHLSWRNPNKVIVQFYLNEKRNPEWVVQVKGKLKELVLPKGIIKEEFSNMFFYGQEGHARILPLDSEEAVQTLIRRSHCMWGLSWDECIAGVRWHYLGERFEMSKYADAMENVCIDGYGKTKETAILAYIQKNPGRIIQGDEKSGAYVMLPL